MLETAIEFLRYFIVLLFGALVAVDLAGMRRTRKNYLVFGCFVILLFTLQVMCLMTWGMAVTTKVYPLLSHLPVSKTIMAFLRSTIL
jgi:two-component system sensor histidine kinase AgrC